MRIRTKLFIPLLLVGVLIISIIVTSEQTNNEIKQYQSDVSTINDFFSTIFDVRIKFDQYIFTGERNDQENYNSSVTTLLAKTETLVSDLSSSQKIVVSISDYVELYLNEQDLFLELNEALHSTILDLKSTSNQLSIGNTLSNTDTGELVSKANTLITTAKLLNSRFVNYEEQSSKLNRFQIDIENLLITLAGTTNSNLEYTIQKQRKQSFIIYSLSILIFGLMTVQLIKVFTVPLKKINRGILNIAEDGDIGVLDINSKDEFQDIAITLKSMNQQIQNNEAELLSVNSKLINSNKELEAFAYSVSHDLRTPLRSISGFSEALLSGHRDQLDETGKNYLDRVGNAAQKMAQLIDDILKLSRITRTTLSKTEIDFNTLAENTFNEEVLNIKPENTPTISFSDEIKVYADLSLTRVLLHNLLGNAIKFSSKNEHPKINLSIVHKDDNAYIAISDNGVGFDMKYVDKLFSPFQRLHTESEFEGTGIGLATVKRIINKHGGSIFVESELGKGTTFYFNFNGTII